MWASDRSGAARAGSLPRLILPCYTGPARGVQRVPRKIKHDPHRHEYMDLALSPVADDEAETLELFQSEVAQTYVRQERRMEKIRHGEAA